MLKIALSYQDGYLKQCMHFVQQVVLHAVQGNPPNSATGRVGAVGHIHLICAIEYPNEHNIFFERTGIYSLSQIVGKFIKYKCGEIG